MKRIISIVFVMSFSIGFFSNSSYSQSKEMKLKSVEYAMIVDVSPQQAWKVLASFGNVASYLSTLESSAPINGSGNEAVMNCERTCSVPNGKKENIVIKERITKISEGDYYTYEVYDWKNFPLEITMLNTFGVKTNNLGQTMIYQKSEYGLSNPIVRMMMKGQMKKGARETLIGYKHYMETGEKNISIEVLKKKYKNV